MSPPLDKPLLVESACGKANSYRYQRERGSADVDWVKRPGAVADSGYSNSQTQREGVV